VGEAPGREENIRGIPFCGRSGKLLDNILLDLEKRGLNLSEVRVTNAVRCQPPNNRNPKADERRTCKQFLDQEIAALRPEVIVTLGAQAACSLLDVITFPVGKNRLNIIGYHNDIPIVPTYHPAAVLYDQSKLKELYDDLYAYLVKEIWRSTPDSNITAHVVSTIPQYRKLIQRIKEANSIGLDIETDGLHGNILTIGVSFPEESLQEGWCIPVHHRESELLVSNSTILSDIRECVLSREDLTVYGHNLIYDLGDLARDC
jgi:uracil-DNA glycosylase family 4